MLMDASIGAVLFGVGRRAAELGATSFEVGVLNAAMPVTYTAFALFCGGVSDKLGRRRVSVGGAAIAAVLALMNAFTTHVWLLVGINVLLGLGVGLFWPALISWISEGHSGRALSKRLARFSVSWNIGLLLGFGLTGFVFKIGGPAMPFMLASAFVTAIVIVLLLPIPADPPSASGQGESEAPVPTGRGFRKTSWLANFGMTFVFFGITALFNKLAIELRVSEESHGLLLALCRAGAFLMFLLLPHFHWWQTRLWPVWVAQGISILTALCFAFSSSTWVFAVALFVGGMMLGFNYQCSIFFTLTEMTEKGKGSGMHEATLGAGMCFGPVIGGVVGDEFGLRAPYLFMAGFMALWIVLQIAIVAWRRKQSRAAALL